MTNDNDMRDRLLLPVLIPVGALALVGFLALSVSQILLNVPKQVATAVALLLAFNLMASFTVVALKPDLGRFLTASMVGVAVVPLLLGAAVAAGIVSLPQAEEGAEAGGPVVQIAAANIAFDKSVLQAPANKPFELVFNNKDAQPHNVAILSAPGAQDALFRGTIVTGPKQTTYKVKGLAPGTYPFRCDVHPNMAGTITIA